MCNAFARVRGERRRGRRDGHAGTFPLYAFAPACPDWARGQESTAALLVCSLHDAGDFFDPFIGWLSRLAVARVRCRHGGSRVGVSPPERPDPRVFRVFPDRGSAPRSRPWANAKGTASWALLRGLPYRLGRRVERCPPCPTNRPRPGAGTSLLVGRKMARTRSRYWTALRSITGCRSLPLAGPLAGAGRSPSVIDGTLGTLITRRPNRTRWPAFREYPFQLMS